MPRPPDPTTAIPPPGAAPLMRPTLLWGVQGRDPVALEALRAARPASPSFRRARRPAVPTVPVVVVPETLAMQLTSAASGAWRRRWFMGDLLIHLIDTVLARPLLRAMALGLLGYAIGLSLEDFFGPHALWSGGRGDQKVSTATIGAATGVALGLSPSMTLFGLLTGSLEFAWALLIVWFGFVAAGVALSDRLANAFNALQF